MRYENLNQDSKDIEKVHRLYETSFPRDEKMPWKNLLKRIDNRDILTAYYNDQNTFTGFTYLFKEETADYLSYFAIEPQLRSKGYGSQILRTLTNIFKRDKIIIDIEELNDQADNAEERRKRRNFYLHNGFEETGIFYNIWHVDYELLSIHGKATREDWNMITKAVWGKFAKLVKYKENSL